MGTTQQTTSLTFQAGVNYAFGALTPETVQEGSWNHPRFAYKNHPHIMMGAELIKRGCHTITDYLEKNPDSLPIKYTYGFYEEGEIRSFLHAGKLKTEGKKKRPEHPTQRQSKKQTTLADKPQDDHAMTLGILRDSFNQSLQALQTELNRVNVMLNESNTNLAVVQGELERKNQDLNEAKKRAEFLESELNTIRTDLQRDFETQKAVFEANKKTEQALKEMEVNNEKEALKRQHDIEKEALKQTYEKQILDLQQSHTTTLSDTEVSLRESLEDEIRDEIESEYKSEKEAFEEEKKEFRRTANGVEKFLFGVLSDERLAPILDMAKNLVLNSGQKGLTSLWSLISPNAAPSHIPMGIPQQMPYQQPITQPYSPPMPPPQPAPATQTVQMPLNDDYEETIPEPEFLETEV